MSTVTDHSVSELALYLRGMRRLHRKRLREVAVGTELSVSFLSDIERGRTEPSLATLRKLAAYYGYELVIGFSERGLKNGRT